MNEPFFNGDLLSDSREKNTLVLFLGNLLRFSKPNNRIPKAKNANFFFTLIASATPLGACPEHNQMWQPYLFLSQPPSMLIFLSRRLSSSTSDCGCCRVCIVHVYHASMNTFEISFTCYQNLTHLRHSDVLRATLLLHFFVSFSI